MHDGKFKLKSYHISHTVRHIWWSSGRLSSWRKWILWSVNHFNMRKMKCEIQKKIINRFFIASMCNFQLRTNLTNSLASINRSSIFFANKNLFIKINFQFSIILETFSQMKLNWLEKIKQSDDFSFYFFISREIFPIVRMCVFQIIEPTIECESN